MSNVKMEMFQHLYGQMERRFQKVLISVKEDQTGSHERVKSHVRNNNLILNTITKENLFIKEMRSIENGERDKNRRYKFFLKRLTQEISELKTVNSRVLTRW